MPIMAISSPRMSPPKFRHHKMKGAGNKTERTLTTTSANNNTQHSLIRDVYYGEPPLLLRQKDRDELKDKDYKKKNRKRRVSKNKFVKTTKKKG